jgi:DNA recombination protein Rad52
MAFTEEQRQALQAKLRVRHVRSRLSNGTTIPYVEGWHVIAEANRIFGYDCWDRTTWSPRCVWREMQRGQTVCVYTAKVRITVSAGGTTIVRDGIGTGTGRSSAPELAHEIAMKAAETDATKRALATFGNPFGLALYDKDKGQVTRSRRRATDRSSSRPSTGETTHGPSH